MAVALPIVVLGDSIQWGQGLRPGAPGAPSDKMAELVGAGLAASPAVIAGWSGGQGVAITVTRFASSGATTNGGLGTPSPLAPVPAPTAFPAGEIPGPVPTILDQAAGAAAAPSASSVRLVILDGGINDVGLFSVILNPLASSFTVAAQATAACGGTLTSAATPFLPPGTTVGNMSAVLSGLGSAFPNAVFVVTGHYDILSTTSAVLGLLFAVGILSGSVVPELLLPGGWLIATLAGTIASATAAGETMQLVKLTAADLEKLKASLPARKAPAMDFHQESLTVDSLSIALVRPSTSDDPRTNTYSIGFRCGESEYTIVVRPSVHGVPSITLDIINRRGEGDAEFSSYTVLRDTVTTLKGQVSGLSADSANAANLDLSALLEHLKVQ